MKYLSFFLVLTTFVCAQDNNLQQQIEPKTKLENFFSKSGRLVVKEFLDSHHLNGTSMTRINFQFVKVYEPGRPETEIRGLKVTISAEQKEAFVFLDADEIESLKRTLEYIGSEKDKLLSNNNYTEIIFNAQDNFRFGAYVKDKEVRLFAQIDKYPYPRYFSDFEVYDALNLLINNFFKVISVSN